MVTDVHASLEESRKLQKDAQASHDQTLKLAKDVDQSAEFIKQQEQGVRKSSTIISQRLQEVGSQQRIVELMVTRVMVARLSGVLPADVVAKLKTSEESTSGTTTSYSRDQLLQLVNADVQKALAFFRRHGFSPPSVTGKIYADDEHFQNVFFDGKDVVFGMGMLEMPFGGYDPAYVYHEATHSLVRLDYVGQAGSVNESVCDVIGVVIRGEGWTFGPVYSEDPAKPQFILSLSAPGTAYKNASMGKDPSPDHMTAFVETASDNGGVHINVGIVNKAAYLISEGGTFREVAIGQGIGRERLGDLYMDVIRDPRMTGKIDFSTFREVVVSNAQRKFGASAAETVRQAFNAVGIG